MSVPICHTGGLPRRRHMVGQLEADGLEARFWTTTVFLLRMPVSRSYWIPFTASNTSARPGASPGPPQAKVLKRVLAASLLLLGLS